MIHSTHSINEGVHMEAIMIAGVAVVAVSGWYSAFDLLTDMGIRVSKRSATDSKSCDFSRACRVATQRRVKQMAGVNV